MHVVKRKPSSARSAAPPPTWPRLVLADGAGRSLRLARRLCLGWAWPRLAATPGNAIRRASQQSATASAGGAQPRVDAHCTAAGTAGHSMAQHSGHVAPVHCRVRPVIMHPGQGAAAAAGRYTPLGPAEPLSGSARRGPQTAADRSAAVRKGHDVLRCTTGRAGPSATRRPTLRPAAPSVAMAPRSKDTRAARSASLAR